jgi:hypothetical protein
MIQRDFTECCSKIYPVANVTSIRMDARVPYYYNQSWMGCAGTRSNDSKKDVILYWNIRTSGRGGKMALCTIVVAICVNPLATGALQIQSFVSARDTVSQPRAHEALDEKHGLCSCIHDSR